MKLFFNIPGERINALSNQYIRDVIMENRTIAENELIDLTCSELAMLYDNTGWFLKNTMNEDKEAESIGRQNQEEFKKAIVNRIQTSPFYVIYTELTRLPYLFNDRLFLIYTDKAKAEQVAIDFQNEYKIPFSAEEVDLKKGDYFALPYICGLREFIVDGTKLIFKLDDIYTYDNSKYGLINPELSIHMIKFTQYIYFNKGDQYEPRVADELIAPIFDAVQDVKLLLPIITREGDILKGFSVQYITTHDGLRWLPLFTDQLAVNKFFKRPRDTLKETFESQYNVSVKDDPSVAGIMLNPAREQLKLDRRRIGFCIEYWNEKALCTEEYNIEGKDVRIGDPENAESVQEWVKNICISVPQVKTAYLRYLLMDNQVSYLLLVSMDDDKGLLADNIESADLSVLQGKYIDIVEIDDSTKHLTGTAAPFYQKR